MTGLIFLGILIVWSTAGVICSRFIIRSFIREEEVKYPHRLKTEEDYKRFADKHQGEALFMGVIGWPVIWIPLLAERLQCGILKGNERLARLKAEEQLEKAKRLARDNGMSFPDA